MESKESIKPHVKTVAYSKNAVIGVEFPLRLILVLLLGCRGN